MTRSDLSRLSVRRAASFAKHKLKTSARKAVSLIRTWQSGGERLLFLYGGETLHWVGMGRQLYEQEPAFRASVQATDAYIRQFVGYSVLANFDGSADAEFFADGTKAKISIVTLQLALTDLWQAKGIQPDTTAGVSLGEIAGVYAAGGLTREDAVRIAASWVLASEMESKEFMALMLQTDLAQARLLCQACPAPLHVVYESGPASVLVMCRERDKPQVSAYLDAHQFGWQQPYSGTGKPYHSPFFERHRPFFRQYLQPMLPQPLRLDYYSATLGKKLPKHAFVPTTLWDDLACSPVLLYGTLQTILADKVAVAVQVGPHPFLTGTMQRSAFDLTRQMLLLDSMQKDDAAGQTFRNTYRRLQRRAWRRWPANLIKKLTASDAFAKFVTQLDFSAPGVIEDPHVVHAYLRRRGNLHYLPVYKAWLVLDYDLVNQVLQNPSIFSSQPNAHLDPSLIGADPPHHTVVRSLLQPLFAPQALAALSNYVTQVVHQHVDVLSARPSFDVVDEFAVPLVQSVTARFLGLEAAEAAALEASLTGHLYAMNYFDDLTRFFGAYLEKLPHQPGEKVGNQLMNYVQAGRLSFADAVSMMKLFWAAGTTTTSMLLSNAVNILLRQPHLAGQLRHNPALIPKFVEECLRLEPSASTASRLTTQDTTLAGQALPAGSLVILSLMAANRDPQVFADADALVLTRPAKRHVAFAGGVHHCIGAGLARLEAQIAIGAILTRLPHLRAAEAGSATYFPSPDLRGLARLPVYTQPAA